MLSVGTISTRGLVRMWRSGGSRAVNVGLSSTWCQHLHESPVCHSFGHPQWNIERVNRERSELVSFPSLVSEGDERGDTFLTCELW